MLRMLAAPGFVALIALTGCQGNSARAPARLTQCDVAQIQAQNLADGMKSLSALREGDTTSAAVFLETVVYNATADILECREYRYDRRMMVWINQVAEYRREHPRPLNARTPIDARLDKLLADYEGKTPLPPRLNE